MIDFMASVPDTVEVTADAEAGIVWVGDDAYDLENARGLAIALMEAVVYLDEQKGNNELEYEK